MFFIQKLVDNDLLAEIKGSFVVTSQLGLKGRAYIKIILKNHARSFYRGNTVTSGSKKTKNKCNLINSTPETFDEPFRKSTQILLNTLVSF